ncbi:MAG TPA: sulfite exporter TauE/SafE family protein [Pyrinomonadaceae bacterium]|nr:sulfite exporter TauE/SafE family protein [Pyrinomonadaceae bacterium]
MNIAEFAVLLAIFLVTSIVGVVTGSNSLITVPAMFQFHIEPRVAVATNMFGLVFMTAGSTIPFIRQKTVDLKKVSPLLIITAVSSALGAMLVGRISADGIKTLVSVSMIAVAVFIVVNPGKGITAEGGRSTPGVFAYGLIFALGIYGGLFSGGYVTILTVVLVAFFGMRFSESIAATKLVNLVSSAIASVLFMWQGLVDYTLGIWLAAAMFVGGYVGAHYAARMNDVWLKLIFLTAVLLLAFKIIYDLIF